jgi:nitrogen-specific signal transduction histidine kinase
MQGTAPSARRLETASLEALLDAVPALALVVRPDGSVAYLNRAAAEASGLGPRPAGLALETILPAGDAARLLAAAGSAPLRASLRAPGRAAVLAEWTATPIGGGLRLVAGRDLAREDALEDYIVSSQWYETAAALSGGLAHEFNNTLAAILGLSEIIGMRLPPDSPLLPFVAKTATCIERAKGLVRRFSQFSRKGSDEIDDQPTALVLSEIATAVLGFLPGSVTLATDIHPDTPWCRVERHALEHVVLNCVSFLRTRLRHDGGRVTLSSGAASSPGWTAIGLAGSGQGVAGLDLEPLFTLQLGRTASAYESGIGLFTARALAERAGGRLTLRRHDPRTIVFSLELPVAE